MATVALFGDSTFQTYYLEAAQNPALVTYHGKSADYAGRLHQVMAALLPGHTVTNYAIGGMDSTEAQTAGFNGTNPDPLGACLASNPDIVVVNFGANDENASIARATFKANLLSMVSRIRAAGKVAVLQTCLHVDYPMHYATDRNLLSALGGYSETIVQVARETGCTLIDMRARFMAEIAAGNWALFGHNDSTYWVSWEDGSTPGTPAYYTNIHPWIEGVGVMADEMASRLKASEPLLGGAYIPGRSDGYTLGTDWSDTMPVYPGAIADWQFGADGYFHDTISGAITTQAAGPITPETYPTGDGYWAHLTGQSVTFPTSGLSAAAGTCIAILRRDETSGTNNTPVAFHAATTNRMYLRLASHTAVRAYAQDATSSTSSDFANVTLQHTVPCAAGITWGSGGYRSGLNGVLRAAVTPQRGVTFGASAYFGTADGSTGILNGYLHRVVFFNRELTDAEFAAACAELVAGTYRSTEEIIEDVLVPIAVIDGNVDAVKEKTDALPEDPADQSAVEAAIVSATNPIAAAVASVLSVLQDVLRWALNRRTVTATQQILYEDDGVTPRYTQTLSDDGTTAERGAAT